MKNSGLLLLFLGLSCAYVSRHDNVEGVYMVPAGIIVAIVGTCMYFEGLKREIIAALRDKSKKE